MAEIEITLPTVQYGNVKIRATPEELGVDVASPAAVGTATAVYLNLFTQGFKVGASMDVSASPTEGLKAPLAAEQKPSEEVFPGAVEAAQEAAQRLLDEGLDGATEVDEEGAAVAAPWDAKVEAPKLKPWETDVTAPAVLDAAW